MSLPYFPMYPTDFEADTSHLTLAEDGAYNRLLRLCWMTPGCSLPDDEAWIMRRMRARTDEEVEAVRTILAEFFKREGGRLFSPRLRKEAMLGEQAHARRVAAGRKGGRPAKALENNETRQSNAKPMPKQPEPEPYIEDTNVSSSRAKRRPRKSVPPRDWHPTPEQVDYACNLGLSEAETHDQASRFVDWHTSERKPRAPDDNFNAAWRNWARRAADNKRSKPRGNGSALYDAAMRVGRREREASSDFGSDEGFDPGEPRMDFGPRVGVVIPLLAAGRA